MATTPIQQTIDAIKAMDTAFSQESCIPKGPFVRYPDTGNPPVIDFNIPQSTQFVTYGHILKYFPPTYFKAFTKNIPANNYYDMVKNMTAEQAVQLFHPNVVAQPTAYANYASPVAASGLRAYDQEAGAYVNLTPHAVAFHTSASETTMKSSPAGPTSGSSFVSAPTALQLPPYLQNIRMAQPQILQVAPPKDVTATRLADFAMQQLRPLFVSRINGLAPITKYVARPPLPVPRLIVIEEYTTASYLGNYGAGRVIRTFTLLPGERTTISVRTYKDKVTTVNASKNMLDSFSESSATELDTLLQHEQGNMSSTSDSSGGAGSSFSTSTDSKNSSKSFGISGGLNIGPLSIGGGYGRSESEMSTSSNGMSNSYDYNHTGVRQSNVNALDSAINKHVQQSNANRTIDINTSTSDTSRSGEEDTTVRELKNVNLNRVLNFTFRQLLQEYETITHLSNVKFAYTNGYPESYTVVDLNNLPNMLHDIINTDISTGGTSIDNVMCKLLQPYCNVMNYDDEFKQFVEKKVITVGNCLQLGDCPSDTTETIYRVKKDCIDEFRNDVIDIKVHGVILSVKKQTLLTSSVIGDALLGAGDALDCFNQKAQDASNMADYISNLSAMQRLEDNVQNTDNNQLFATQQLAMGSQQMDVVTQNMSIVSLQREVISGIPDPNDKAKLYKKVFGDCCDVPQSCCGGCGCEEPTPPTP
jgi:hypothetical protein